MTSILHYFLVDKTFTCHPGKGGHEMISQLSQSEYNTINAPVHCTKDDPVFFCGGCISGRMAKFVITDQPVNSPDTNILDLGFFASIQRSLHFQ
jgi:hypothetical protein